MLTEAHKQRRLAGIGGSEIGAVIGVNPYMTAGDVCADKIGLSREDPDSEPIWWGNVLEEPIRQEYERRSGLTVRRFEDGELPIEHPEHPVVLASFDGLAKEGQSGVPVAVYEGKASGFYGAMKYGSDGTDDVPPWILAQGAWYVSVAYRLWGVDRCDFALFDGGALRYRPFTYHRDPELEGRLIERAEAFWRDHVLAKKMPTPDDSKRWSETFARWWPETTGDYIPSTHETDELAERLIAVRQQMADLEAVEREIENRIKREIGDRDGIDGSWGRISWKYAKPSPAWKQIAEALGADKRADLLTKYVGKASRRFTIKVNEDAARHAA